MSRSKLHYVYSSSLLMLCLASSSALHAEEAKTSTAGQSSSEANPLSLYQENSTNQPRLTPLNRVAMKQYIEQLKNRTPRIPLPEPTEAEIAAANGDSRNTGYEGRLRNLYLGQNNTSGYMVFGGSPNRANDNRASSSGNPAKQQLPPDPTLTLDYAFKVRLFWIAARANNCQYCLGHQESKLLGAGMLEDEIAALDSNWEVFPEKEQAAFALALRLTREPHNLTASDVEKCRAFYSDLQILEMIGSVAGNNAINRWKEGAGIPQSTNGGNFGRASSTESQDEHTYLTPTSESYASRPSKVVAVANTKDELATITICDRPALESGAQLRDKLSWTASRKPLVPLVDEQKTREVLGTNLTTEAELPNWKRLVANFPVAGRRFVEAVAATNSLSEIDQKLQQKINYVVARQDRAWYNVASSKKALTDLGYSEEQINLLDNESLEASSILTKEEASLVKVAKDLAASPIVLTDDTVTRAVEIVGPKAVTQTIHYTAIRAMLNRITEAVQLPADKS